jgi:hypothetical protein
MSENAGPSRLPGVDRRENDASWLEDYGRQLCAVYRLPTDVPADLQPLIKALVNRLGR